MVLPKSSFLLNQQPLILLRSRIREHLYVLDIVPSAFKHNALHKPHKDPERKALLILNFADKKLGLEEVK